ncbi:MAG TPA: alpha/beta fold hydrolase [Thermoanaerobaculia bacterium]|jgi:pimeloyl-ACP methyl ester carboxylesterase
MNPTAAIAAHPINSTNVRSWADRAAPGPLRAFFRTAGPGFPKLAGAVASRLFVTPPRPKVSPRVAGILTRGERFTVRWRRGSLRAWSWGDGPTVLLIHGWGGYGAQFASFIPALEAAGYHAVAIDGPAHGASDGRRTNLLEFAEAIQCVAAEIGPLAGVVAHSFGGASTALAMSRGLAPGRRVVFIAPASDPVVATQRFAAALALPDSALRAMRSRLERRIGVRFEELRIPRLVADFDVPLRVVHDREDREIPWEEGSAIAAAWPAAELVTTRGLGHYRILHDPEVIRGAVEFLGGLLALRDELPLACRR